MNCIRVSITIYDQVNAGKTIVFVPNNISSHETKDGTVTLHSGVNTKQVDEKYIMDGVDYYSDPSSKTEAVKNGEDYIVIPWLTDVTTLNTYMGGFDTNAENGNPTQENTLFALTDSNQVWVTIRIWAEGTHPDCTEEIAGAQINLKLKFGAVAVPSTEGSN